MTVRHVNRQDDGLRPEMLSMVSSYSSSVDRLELVCDVILFDLLA